MFTYTTCDGETKNWQEEEVAWGNYMPYKIVELAAATSVDRFMKRGDWPGSDRGNEIAPKLLLHGHGITTVYRNGTRGILCWMDCWSGMLGNHTYDKDKHHYLECNYEMHDWKVFRT